MQLVYISAVIIFTLNTFAIRSLLAQNIAVPKDGDRYDFDFVHSYTQYLHGVYRFKSFIIFSHDQARWRPNGLIVRTLEHALCADFNMPIIVSGKENPTQFRHVIGLNGMVFVQMISINDTILESVDHALEGLHFITILFFYKAKDNIPPTATEILKFFYWCWHRNMINVALTFQYIERAMTRADKTTYIQNQVYTYTPFPKMTVQNLTDEVAKGGGSFTTDRIKDVNGYTFVTPVYKHEPYVFMKKYDSECNDTHICSDRLTGTAGLIYKEYVKKINGTIKLLVYSPTHVDLVELVTLAPARKTADIVPHPFSEVILSNDRSAGSYPIAQSNLCIILPVKREMDHRLYLLRVFQTNTWFWVLCTFLLLLSLEICFNSKSLGFGIKRFGYALVTAVDLLINQLNRTTPARAAGSVNRIFHSLMPFTTSVLAKMFAASLTALLSTAPYGAQIETVAELLASDLQVMTTVVERTLFFERNWLPAELIPKLHIVESDILEYHRRSLNESFAYVLTAEMWQLLDNQQKHLRKPLFRIGGRELCSSKFFIRFPVQWDSPFTQSLTLFFMLTQESGLSLKWEQTSTQLANKRLAKNHQKDVDRWRLLCVEHFIFAICFTCCMWFVGIICFLLEIIWFHILIDYFRELKRESLIYYKRLKGTLLNEM